MEEFEEEDRNVAVGVRFVRRKPAGSDLCHGLHYAATVQENEIVVGDPGAQAFESGDTPLDEVSVAVDGLPAPVVLNGPQDKIFRVGQPGETVAEYCCRFGLGDDGDVVVRLLIHSRGVGRRSHAHHAHHVASCRQRGEHPLKPLVVLFGCHVADVNSGPSLSQADARTYTGTLWRGV